MTLKRYVNLMLHNLLNRGVLDCEHLQTLAKPVPICWNASEGCFHFQKKKLNSPETATWWNNTGLQRFNRNKLGNKVEKSRENNEASYGTLYTETAAANNTATHAREQRVSRYFPNAVVFINVSATRRFP